MLSDFAMENLEERELEGVLGARGTATLRSAGGPWRAMRRARVFSGGLSDIFLRISGVAARESVRCKVCRERAWLLTYERACRAWEGVRS